MSYSGTKVSNTQVNAAGQWPGRKPERRVVTRSAALSANENKGRLYKNKIKCPPFSDSCHCITAILLLRFPCWIALCPSPPHEPWEKAMFSRTVCWPQDMKWSVITFNIFLIIHIIYFLCKCFQIYLSLNEWVSEVSGHVADKNAYITFGQWEFSTFWLQGKTAIITLIEKCMASIYDSANVNTLKWFNILLNYCIITLKNIFSKSTWWNNKIYAWDSALYLEFTCHTILISKCE